jgi:hypothetical protein
LTSADEHNNSRRDVAEKALAHIKKQKTVESKDIYYDVREQITQQGAAAMQQTKSDYDTKLDYWQAKSDTLEKEKKN